MIGIYKITNKINGKVYIGQSVNIENRWNEHKYALTKDSLIHRAIRKYGKGQFDFCVICECEKSELNELEQKYISEYNSMHPNGYNLTSGGGQCIVYSEESRRKMSESSRGEKNPLWGKHRSEETRKKIGDAQRGRKLSQERIEQMRLISKGKRLSEETKRKIGDAQRGEKNHWWHKQLPEDIKRKISESHKGL